jgi:hypothetical protein
MPSFLTLGRVPLDDRLLGVPGIAVEVDRGAVIDDAAVDRPAPGELWVHADIEGAVFQAAAAGAVARDGCVRLLVRLDVAVTVEPVAGGRRAVGLEPGKAVQELTRGQVVAVDLPGDGADVRVLGTVVPG